MQSINNFLLPFSINDKIVFLLLFIALMLYFYQRNKSHTLLKRKKKLLDISSRLVDHPVIIFSEQCKVICANEHIQKYIKIKRGDSVNDISEFPFVRIKNKWKSLSEILDLYKKSNQDILYLTEVLIKTDKEEEEPVNIHISSSGREEKKQYIGLAIFDIKDHLELSKIYYQNTTTGLPNHNKAIADIGLMASKMLSKNKKFAVSVISIDQFLEVISTIGYLESLDIVNTIGRYLQKASFANNFHLYHMTSNNFLLILPDIENNETCRNMVNKYKNDCEQLLHNKNSQLQFTISAGISLYPNSTINNLINDAYYALSLSIKQGLGYTTLLTPDKKIKKKDSPIDYSEIKRALETEEFILYYQPIYRLSDHTIVAAEALIRWNHPTRGILTPFHFLPLVENTGFMKPLSEYISREVIQQLAAWNTLEFKKIQLAINLSMREFETADFPSFLGTLLEKNKVNTSQLKVEITENIAMANEDYSTAQFNKLQKLGIGISLDDFGTGYSSFSMLESFPINTLKIDRSFITDIADNPDHYTIVKAMIAMAHTLGIKVIAEGIEHDSTMSILKELGCDYVQGYYLGKPMPVFEFQELIRSEKQPYTDNDIIILD